MDEDQERGISRRGFLKGTAAVSLGTAATAAGVTAGVTPAAADPLPATPPHGSELRGMSLATQSPTTEGRFGFMFKNLPPHRPADDLLKRLGEAMAEQPVKGTQHIDPNTGLPVTNPDGTPFPAGNNENDAFNENPNPRLTSGFTFVGQFVDHDITFDTTPIDQQQADPNATTNFRVPRYDLDSLYGRGPSTDPHLYDPKDRDKFLVVQRPYNQIKGLVTTPATSQDIVYNVKPDVVWDVPRDANGKAIIGDPRNDQTIIISQMHAAMQMFHNKIVDYMRGLRVPRAAVFESARRVARWHYQWMVIHDFLPAIVGQAMADSVYKEVLTGTGIPIIKIKYYKTTNPLGRPYIPVEFSVAAYRFGHSITRPRYTVRDVFDSAGNLLGAVSSVPLFEANPTENNLNGHRPVPARLKMQWSKFFNADPAKPTARPVRQFDASLGSALFSLPPTALPDSVSSENLLSVRNLKRGKLLGLPSGQQVALKMGVTPLTNAELSRNHRIHVKIPISGNVVQVTTPPAGPGEFDETNQALTQVFNDGGWGGEAPLWFYILKEAEIVGRGRELGPVGGRIVAEVLVGLLQKDPNSYLYLQPGWKPAPPIAPARGKFTMADLLKYAGAWS